MRSWQFLALILTILSVTGCDAGAAAEERRPLTRYRVIAGDLTGDRAAEVVRWDSESRRLRVYRDSAGSPVEVSSHVLENFPTAMLVSDVDGDGRGELLIGEGLDGYNPETGAPTDVQLRLYEPFEQAGWRPVELYRRATERPAFTSLEVAQLDGDPEPEILFGYYASKYYVDIAVADRRSDRWVVEVRHQERMATSLASLPSRGDARRGLVIGRPYGDPVEEAATGEDGRKIVGTKTTVGGAFILVGDEREELPVYRGVSSVRGAVVDDDGGVAIVVGDGWHFDYGKVARARLALLRRVAGDWTYELIEDVPEHTRVRVIRVLDVDGDGRDEIIIRGDRKRSLGGDVRVYRKTARGWRGATVASNVQAFATGDLTGDGTTELIVAGKEPRTVTLDLARMAWDPQLARAVETYRNDPDTLVGRPAPELRVEEWYGGGPLTLASLKGKVVLLDFWATWCGPCIKGFPTLRQWAEEFGPEKLAIIGVTNHSSQTSEDVASFLDENPLPWPTALDPGSRPHMDYGTGPIPHQVIIDRRGVIYSYYVGGGAKLDSIKADLDALTGSDPAVSR